MKRVRIASIVILVITLIIAGTNMFFVALPDWSVRVTHIVMLIALIAVIFCTVRIRNHGDWLRLTLFYEVLAGQEDHA